MTDADTARPRPRKELGQHFLLDDLVIDQIVNLVAPQPDDRIIEIGPGTGALTASLLHAAGALTAIEVDRELAAALRRRFAQAGDLDVVECDVLRYDFSRHAGTTGRLKLVGNLPYNISTPLLLKLLAAGPLFSEITVMVQREVAERLFAAAGEPAYGRLSVVAGHRAEIWPRLEVPPECFDPPPRVDSSVVQLNPRERSTTAAFDRAFEEIVRHAFARRRKTISNALRGHVSPAQLARADIDPGCRAETVTVAQFQTLTAITQADSPPD